MRDVERRVVLVVLEEHGRIAERLDELGVRAQVVRGVGVVRDAGVDAGETLAIAPARYPHPRTHPRRLGEALLRVFGETRIHAEELGVELLDAVEHRRAPANSAALGSRRRRHRCRRAKWRSRSSVRSASNDTRRRAACHADDNRDAVIARMYRRGGRRVGRGGRRGAGAARLSLGEMRREPRDGRELEHTHGRQLDAAARPPRPGAARATTCRRRRRRWRGDR